MERGFIGLEIAVLAVSDVAMKLADEAPAQLVLERVGLAGHRVIAHAVVPETLQAVKAKYLEWIADPAIDVVIVTAGAKSDVASEALGPMITKRMTGFADLFRFLTYDEIGTAAMLVDAAAGQCKQTFVFVLPASIGAVRTALDKLLLPQLDYRTKPANLVMRMPRYHGGVAEVTGPVKTPWIVAKPGGSVTTPAAVAPPPKRGGTEPGPPAALSASQRIELAAVQGREHVSVSQRMAAVIETAATPRPRPAGVRSKTPTTNAIVPLKPPAQVVPLAALLTNTTEPLASPPANDEVEAKIAAKIDQQLDAQIAEVTPLPMPVVALGPAPTPVTDQDEAQGEAQDEAQIDEIEEVNEIVEVPRRETVPPAIPPRAVRPANGVALPTPPGPIEDAAMHEAILAAQKRAVTERVTVLDDPPRSVAIPSRKRANRQRAITASAIVLSALALVVLFAIARHRAQLAAANADPVLAPPPPPPRDEPVARSEPRPVTEPVTEPVPPMPIEPPPPPPKQAEAKLPSSAKLATPRPAIRVAPGCDEVSCVLDGYHQRCCARWKPAAASAAVHATLPEKIDRATVTAAIARVKPVVIKCGEGAAGSAKGTVKVSVEVAPSGAVMSVGVVATPDAALGTCVANAVRKASFGASVQGGSFAYPFVF